MMHEVHQDSAYPATAQRDAPPQLCCLNLLCVKRLNTRSEVVQQGYRGRYLG